MAATPVLSDDDRVATITLKGWRFSDGEVVDAESVELFLNLYKADRSGLTPTFGRPLDSCYVPGTLPDDLVNVQGAPSGDTVTLTFSTPVNPVWLVEDELSQIVPLPEAWNTTTRNGGEGSGGCGAGTFDQSSTLTACQSVLDFVVAQGARAPRTGPTRCDVREQLGGQQCDIHMECTRCPRRGSSNL